MALPLPPTLVQLRESVSIRIGLATSGKLSLSLQKVINEHLNKCQREIFLRCTWARQVIDVTIPTVQAQRVYDVPDEAGAIGGLQRIDIEDLNGVRWPLVYEDTLGVENNTSNVNEPSRPTTWQFIDDTIRVSPTVDAVTYPTLNVRLIRGDAPLIVDGDRASVDGEALVQYATIITKEYMNVAGPQKQARDEFQQYLLDLRSASVGPGRMFNIASERIDGPAYWRWPTVDAAVLPYSSAWNPPGVW